MSFRSDRSYNRQPGTSSKTGLLPECRRIGYGDHEPQKALASRLTDELCFQPPKTRACTFGCGNADFAGLCAAFRRLLESFRDSFFGLGIASHCVKHQPVHPSP